MNNSIHDYLINIFDKLSHKSTLLNGIALFKYLIKKEFYSNEKCLFIIKEISEQINKLNVVEKKEILILLPYFFINRTSLNYIKKILYIIFSQINHSTENIFNIMAKIYGDIIKNVENFDFMGGYENSEQNILLKFCIDLININNSDTDDNHKFIFKNKISGNAEDIYFQKCGFLFLEQFIENSKHINNNELNINQILNILKENFVNIKNKNFWPKIELLICINKFINKLKQDFVPYISDFLNIIYTFDKSLLYTGTDVYKIKNDIFPDLKKYLLDIIYSILIYNKENINEDDLNKILSYAKINKINLNKEIRSLSLKIINLINNSNKEKNSFNAYNYYTNNKSNTKKNYISNYLSNDSLIRKTFSNSNLKYKERPFSLRGKENSTKKMIEEDKKKYEEKKFNKKFIFVSQSLNKESKSNNKVKNNIKVNNLNVVNLKVYEIKNMNDTMIKTVNNIENYLNNNFNNIESKLNKINNLEEKYTNKKKLFDEKIKNIILNDDELINFIDTINEKNLNYISIKLYEEIIERFMILILVNKNKKDICNKYKDLLYKLLNNKKIEINNDNNNNEDENNNIYQKYKISYNLENNLQYLFKSLNN